MTTLFLQEIKTKHTFVFIVGKYNVVSCTSHFFTSRSTPGSLKFFLYSTWTWSRWIPPRSVHLLLGYSLPAVSDLMSLSRSAVLEVKSGKLRHERLFFWQASIRSVQSCHISPDSGLTLWKPRVQNSDDTIDIPIRRVTFGSPCALRTAKVWCQNCLSFLLHPDQVFEHLLEHEAEKERLVSIGEGIDEDPACEDTTCHGRKVCYCSTDQCNLSSNQISDKFMIVAAVTTLWSFFI